MNRFDQKEYNKISRLAADRAIKNVAEASLGNCFPFEGSPKEHVCKKEYLVNTRQQLTIARFADYESAIRFRNKHARFCNIVLYAPTQDEIEDMHAKAREQARFESTGPHRPLNGQRSLLPSTIIRQSRSNNPITQKLSIVAVKK